DFMLPNDISKIQEQCPCVFIYQSKDDPVVPFADALHYAAALPKAKLITFEENGHFRQAEFPELVQQIKELVK
ncbi:MAG: alpha/beta hydrolase, partial [bacterium]